MESDVRPSGFSLGVPPTAEFPHRRHLWDVPPEAGLLLRRLPQPAEEKVPRDFQRRFLRPGLGLWAEGGRKPRICQVEAQLRIRFGFLPARHLLLLTRSPLVSGIVPLSTHAVPPHVFCSQSSSHAPTRPLLLPLQNRLPRRLQGRRTLCRPGRRSHQCSPVFHSPPADSSSHPCFWDDLEVAIAGTRLPTVLGQLGQHEEQPER